MGNIIFYIEFFYSALSVIFVIFIIYLVIQINRYNMKEYSPFIKGLLKKEGEVLSNKTVILSVTNQGKTQVITSTTNVLGEFTFDPIYGRHSKALDMFDGLFEIRVGVSILVNVDNEDIVIWNGFFYNFQIEDYERSNLANIDCEITNPLMYFGFKHRADSCLDYCYSQSSLFGYVDSGIYSKSEYNDISKE